jgi:tRNA threonylcarbamoyl adenosine modification protein YeaZ
MMTQPILAYDCACEGASIALMHSGERFTHRIEQSQQAGELVASIDALLQQHGVAYTDLACIVTTVGPGSFTGVRIGLAALHGFALVAQVPIKLVTTLAAAAWQVAATPASPEAFYVALRAGKGEVYAQAFRVDGQQPQPTGDIFLAPESKADWDMPCLTHAPDAALLCTIAEYLPSASLAQAVPVYIRPPDAKTPAAPSWLAAN